MKTNTIFSNSTLLKKRKPNKHIDNSKHNQTQSQNDQHSN